MAELTPAQLLEGFDRLHEEVLDMPRKQFTPTAVLDRLDALIDRLHTLEVHRPPRIPSPEFRNCRACMARRWRMWE